MNEYCSKKKHYLYIWARVIVLAFWLGEVLVKFFIYYKCDSPQTNVSVREI